MAGLSARADEATAGKPGEGHPASEAPAAEAPAPTKDWSVTLGQDYYSEYIFRGVDLLRNNAIWVPSVVGKYKNLTAYYYGYYGSGLGKNQRYEEADFGADVTLTAFDGKLALVGGALGYVYPDGTSGKDTYEFYGKASWSNYLNPYIGLNWDVHAFHGGYGAAGVSHAYDLTGFFKLKDGQTLSIIPSAALGIDFGYNWRGTKDNVTWNDVLLGVNLPYYITPALCVHVQYQCSIALNSVHAIGGSNESIVNAGISYSF